MKTIKTYSIPFRGGIVSPGILADVLDSAAKAGVSKVRLGLRQQLLIDLRQDNSLVFEKEAKSRGLFLQERHQAPPGIMSAYPVIHFYQLDSWLREGVYKDVLDQFETAPRLKINITEQYQSFVPLYTGHINWVTTDKAHYWRLSLRLPASQELLHWPEWIYTNNIATVSAAVESVLLDPVFSVRNAPGLLQMKVRQRLDELHYIYMDQQAADKKTRFYLPYYEGFNKMGATYWLGIYRRDEYFDLEFLREICRLCLETKIAEIYTTPWKSLIIKDIDPASRPLWDFILGKYRINVRHAANELNWQIEDGSEEGLSLKRAVIRHFDKEDVRTYGLCFGVQTKPHSKLFASVLIKKRMVRNPNRLKSLDRYDIVHTVDFNPNTQDWVAYRTDVKKEYIGTYLVSLCKVFYSRAYLQEPVQPAAAAPEDQLSVEQRQIYQCPACLNIYDPDLGDKALGIEPGTFWEALAPDYCCPVCGEEKAAFKQISPEQLGI